MRESIRKDDLLMTNQIYIKRDSHIAEPPRGTTGCNIIGSLQGFNIVLETDETELEKQTTKVLSTRAKEILQKIYCYY